MKKRIFILGILCCFLLSFCAEAQKKTIKNDVIDVLKQQILKEANQDLKEKPITITAYVSSRSAGGKHDFYSEGDYWWPDPNNPNGPYIRKDGLTNPDNFVSHRLAMIRFSRIIGALASAYQITGDQKYVKQAILHLRAWFINPETKMNPNLEYAQAIKGLYTGRGIGIIDTIHLLDVVQGILVMEDHLNPDDLKAVKDWFSSYLNWLMTSKNGQDEMNAKNNHGTCFTLQVAEFARLTGDKKLLNFCANRYETILLPNQMAENGSFPLEMKRTKPFGYSIFNLEAMTTLCQVLSAANYPEFDFQTKDNRSIKNGISFLFPYLKDKSKWPLKPDVMYWNDWPIASCFLLFGAKHYDEGEWLQTWKDLDHDPKEEEIIRNMPIKYPVIWLN